MFAPLAAWLLAVAAAPDSSAPPHAASPPPRIVREFAPVTVVGGRRNDRYSSEVVHTVSRDAIRRLPVDRLSDAIALQAGVVAVGEDLHVRGGRAGELATTLGGILLNESQRGVPTELPLFAVRAAELLAGGLDADHAGAIAGELDLQTEVPTERPSWLARWTSDGRHGSGFDAGHVRISSPLPWRGLGVVAAGEARLDDQGFPSLRSRGRTRVLGRSFGWRQDNHVLGWAKLAPVESPQRASLEVLSQRVVRQPYDPMFSFDGWVSFGGSGESGGNPNLSVSDHHPGFGNWYRYRAADHHVMTEDRRWAAIATLASGSTALPARVTLGWTRARSLTSVGLQEDPGYVTDQRRLVFGPYDWPGVDPFHAYFGDESYFRLAKSERFTLRADARRLMSSHHALRAGAGVTYEEVSLFELDDAAVEVSGIDTVRAYHAFAPGGFAYVQHRWDFGGLVWNGGVRLQVFDAGPQAQGASPNVSWSPRAGFAYPVSDRDVFSLSYSRVFQDPPRDLLYENRRWGYDRHPMGNGALVPSEVISFQAAVKHILDPEWSLQLSVFARDVYGEPGTRNVPVRPGLFRLTFTSDDVAHAQGFELSLLEELPQRQRIEITYTFLNAWGTQSNVEGLAYGNTIGVRPLPTGERPLDWDERHSVAVSAQLHTKNHWDLSWSTRVATGRPWSPVYRTGLEGDDWPPQYEDQSALNSKRLELTEHTQAAARWTPRFLRGARLMLMVTNLFDAVRDARATLSGYPNPFINTSYDMYGAYRTETGNSGGAYWNDTNGDGIREWVPVNDARLGAPRRSVRLGIEVGM